MDSRGAIAGDGTAAIALPTMELPEPVRPERAERPGICCSTVPAEVPTPAEPPTPAELPTWAEPPTLPFPEVEPLALPFAEAPAPTLVGTLPFAEAVKEPAPTLPETLPFAEAPPMLPFAETPADSPAPTVAEGLTTTVLVEVV